jgi:hypothetical protein
MTPTPRVWVLGGATALSIISTVVLAIAPGEGPLEARAILVGGFAAMTALMAYMTWLATRGR